MLGYVPDVETAPGGTDATVMIHAGHIPTLVEMGAAGGLSHDYHEFVERDMITAGAKILALMAIDVLVGASGRGPPIAGAHSQRSSWHQGCHPDAVIDLSDIPVVDNHVHPWRAATSAPDGRTARRVSPLFPRASSRAFGGRICRRSSSSRR